VTGSLIADDPFATTSTRPEELWRWTDPSRYSSSSKRHRPSPFRAATRARPDDRRRDDSGRTDPHLGISESRNLEASGSRSLDHAGSDTTFSLVDDLHDRGLDQDVSVIAWGEFGRTPKINAGGGRDHWPQASCAILAGGGMRTGQVIGSTNRLGEHAQDRPVTFPEVFATLYHNLGIDVETATVPDLQGRPRYLVEDEAKPLREVV
jgi:hypothetical protein